MESTPILKFRTETTIMGIKVSDLLGSLIIVGPFAFVLNMFISGLPLLLIVGSVWWFGVLRVMEFIRERIPPKFFAHFIEWLRVGGNLYVTNDGNPIPLIAREQHSPKR